MTSKRHLRLAARNIRNRDCDDLTIHNVYFPDIKRACHSTHLVYLMLCIETNRHHLLKLALEEGIDPNGYDSQGNTLLHRAVRIGRLEVAKHLLTHNIRVNQTDHRSFYPLELTRDIQTALLLLRHGDNQYCLPRQRYSKLSKTIYRVRVLMAMCSAHLSRFVSLSSLSTLPVDMFRVLDKYLFQDL
jgi:ankyrin repeat protein